MTFERLYAECFGAVQRFCYFKLPSKADGDDVVQDVALTAWAKRDTVRSAEAFKPWLLTIAANKVRDFYRKRSKQSDLPLAEIREPLLPPARWGTPLEESVSETLALLGENDRQILALAYLQNLPQAEIASRLNIALGTVKSRLHNARRRFKSSYPYPMKGEKDMKKLPNILPEYKIEKTGKPPFDCVWEEMMGWFAVPRLGQKISWAIYDLPERKRTEQFTIEAVGRASVHGITGIELVAREQCSGEHEGHGESRKLVRTFVAQLTDTHCRILSESHMRDGVKHHYTFLDGDDFIDNWGFGQDNCGNEINPKPKNVIVRDGQMITCPAEKFVLDVVDRCTVTLNGKEYDTIRVMDIECYNTGTVSEQFLDENGRTILWRRFNRDDWRLDYYKQKWSEKLPENERLLVNGETYVHWYDCITDYIL